MEIQLPQEFEDRIRRDLGNEADSFLRSFIDAPKRGLRINPLKTDEAGEKRISADMEHVPWERHGYCYEDSRPGRSPLHAAGAYYIQEPSAMAPVGFLGLRPGMCVLDLCAAPGGKSTQIASYLAGEGLLTANEPVRERAAILSQNIERMGIRNALVLSHDPERLAERFPAAFDRILVDAPCSGEGMMRRDETAVREWSLQSAAMCAKRQETILDAAAVMLKPGGRLVYSTCTFSQEENEEQTAHFLEKYKDFHMAEVSSFPGMRAEGGMIRIWPQDGYGEGHFMAVLDRDGVNDHGSYGYHGAGELPLNNKQKQEIKPYLDFVSDVIKDGDLRAALTDEKRLFAFGKKLCLMPSGGLPVLSGLKVVRAGLELGELHRDRFMPSHALALALKPKDAVRVFELGEDDREGSDARLYFSGQIIKDPAPRDNGWTLVTVSGIAAGWVKASNGILKNHYPKGLRINYQ